MRTLTNHIVEGDSANHQLHISVLDEPGQGGACHLYAIEHCARRDDQPLSVTNGKGSSLIHFQNGPIKEFGVNGVTHEALLAIVIDRLRCFQAGPFSCRENAIALTKFEEGLMWLQCRTRNRIKRGVEGEHKA